MFYISNISGALQPFDPWTGVLPRVAAPVSPAQPMPEKLFQVQEGSPRSPASPSATSAQAPSLTPSGTLSGGQQLNTAAAYEGHALANSIEPLNLGRAGGISAYQNQETLSPVSETPTETTRRVSEVGAGSSVGDSIMDSPDRVNRVRSSGYRKREPERREVVIAADIMSSPVFSLGENEPLSKGVKIFAKERYRHIPILSSSKQLVGIISDRDLLHMDKNIDQVPIRQLMKTDILTARPEAPIREVAEVMILHRIGCLPVLDSGGAVIGIVTRGDILRAVVNHAPIELWS